jgi:phosphatidylserine decarboxylase
MIRLRESWLILVASAAVFAAAYAFWPPSAALPAVLFAFTLYFFRDPERLAPQGRNLLVSPADGRVLYVEETVDPYVGKARRLAIFMSPFDVHVNRAPFDAKVASVRHTPGKKIAAYMRGDLSARERNRLELEGSVRLAVEQYAGVVARRIVCFVREGDSVSRGGRVGMIRFGSRVDVLAPLSVKYKVDTGDRVAAGETVIGELKDG